MGHVWFDIYVFTYLLGCCGDVVVVILCNRWDALLVLYSMYWSRLSVRPLLLLFLCLLWLLLTVMVVMFSTGNITTKEKKTKLLNTDTHTHRNTKKSATERNYPWPIKLNSKIVHVFCLYFLLLHSLCLV